MVIGEPKIHKYPSQCPKADTDSTLFRDYFRMRGIIGQGQYGVVLLVQCVYNPSNLEEELSAIKVIYKSRLHNAELTVIRSEATIL